MPTSGNIIAQCVCVCVRAIKICQYKLSNIWIDRKMISRLTKFSGYSQETNFSYNSNSILKGLLRICSHEEDIEDKGRGRREADSASL